MKQKRIFNIIRELLPYFIIIIVVLLIKTFIFTTIIVDGDSMNDTLKNKDIMILDKISYRFQKIERFDVVVSNVSGTRLIKRVIGLPGEHIKYEGNKLYVNGKEIKDEHGSEITYDFDIQEYGYQTIPENCYFVLGDNRTNSVDSRIVGLIKQKDIKGHARFILFPFNRFGKVNES